MTMTVLDVAIIIVTLVLAVMAVIAVIHVMVLAQITYPHMRKIAGISGIAYPKSLREVKETTEQLKGIEANDEPDAGEQHNEQHPEKKEKTEKPRNKRWAFWRGRNKTNEEDERPDDEPGEDNNKLESDFKADYAKYGFEDLEDTETDAQDEDGELELCREIERLMDRADKLKECADSLELEIPEELLIEEYDELTAGADALKQEVEHLKTKINGQIDYIEATRKKQAEKVDNSGNEEPFLGCVANVLSNMQQQELVYKPQRQRGNQSYTYVSSAEFFELLSDVLPDYKKKNVLENLKQHGIIESAESGYDTVYNKKRVLKVNSKQFVLLTTEMAQDAGA